MAAQQVKKVRNLALIFADQLDEESAAFADLDVKDDAVLMMEVEEEAAYVPQHKIRLVLFFSAMRHFAEDLKKKGYPVYYSRIDDPSNRGSFYDEISKWGHETHPDKLVCVLPGDYRVKGYVEKAAKEIGCGLDIREDRHFLLPVKEFNEYARGRKALLLESFYRFMRRREGILMDGRDPVAGKWNFDVENRQRFGQGGPEKIKGPRSFKQDRITREVIKMVERRFPHSPGNLAHYDYPATRPQARSALRDFIENRLERFGMYQDAMARGHPYLYHSRLSCVLNLHLLNPREVIDAAVKAYEGGNAPINSTEGFVRQVLGWREYIRGVYWLKMPEYEKLNALDANLPMPSFMWTAETDMACIRQCVSQLLSHAYAHHIQRLMVMGLLGLLLGVHPYEFHRWHLSMYADAVDWVSLPNVLGMSQYGDGGIVGTKPYAASGAYIDRMSDYCAKCRYRPAQALGDNACPFTTLYWDFLSRNRQRLKDNWRMKLQYRNLDRRDERERRKIHRQAESLRRELTKHTYLPRDEAVSRS